MIDVENVVGFVPLIGDGNPATLEARQNLHTRENPQGDFSIFHPVVASTIARQLHRIMTWSEALREFYTRSGEEQVRSSASARILGAMFYHSLCKQLLSHELYTSKAPLSLTLVQEHLLLGAATDHLLQHDFAAIQLLIPDTQPKESAIVGLLNHPQVTAVTWNTDTYDLLTQRGLRSVQLGRPELIQGHTNLEHYVNLQNRGTEIVVKTSGSGMPREVREVLLAALRAQKHPWLFHSPDNAFYFDGKREYVRMFGTAQSRRTDFYQNLGGKTRLLITYPNEQIQAVTELVACGCSPHLLLLPPRGEHELNNIRFALKHFPHLVRGIIVRKPKENYSWAKEFDGKINFISLSQVSENLS